MSQELAIVILNWNGKALLEQFLPSVIKNSPKGAVYIIDNASTDYSIDFVEKKYPEISIIQLEENQGYAGGYQKGLKEIDAEFYCLLNSDIKVTEHWLSPILELFKQDKNIAAIQPKILDFKKPEYFEYAGAGGGLIDSLGYPYCQGRIFDTIEKDEGQYNDTTPIFWASGACLFVRSRDFWDVGGLDTDYFAHQEEIDLCWRFNNAYKKVYYCGESYVYHVGGASLSYENPRKVFLNFRNSLISILKNEPFPSVVSKIIIRMILDGLAGVKFLLERKPKSFIAILKAHFSFYSMVSSTLKKRKGITHKKMKSQTISIIWDYYVLNKKYFK